MQNDNWIETELNQLLNLVPSPPPSTTKQRPFGVQSRFSSHVSKSHTHFNNQRSSRLRAAQLEILQSEALFPRRAGPALNSAGSGSVEAANVELHRVVDDFSGPYEADRNTPPFIFEKVIASPDIEQFPEDLGGDYPPEPPLRSCHASQKTEEVEVTTRLQLSRSHDTQKHHELEALKLSNSSSSVSLNQLPVDVLCFVLSFLPCDILVLWQATPVARAWSIALQLDSSWQGAHREVLQRHNAEEGRPPQMENQTSPLESYEAEPSYVLNARIRTLTLLKERAGVLNEELEHLATRYARTTERLHPSELRTEGSNQDDDDGFSNDDESMPSTREIYEAERAELRRSDSALQHINTVLAKATVCVKKARSVAYDVQLQSRDEIRDPLSRSVSLISSDCELASQSLSSARSSSDVFLEGVELAICRSLVWHFKEHSDDQCASAPPVLELASSLGHLCLWGCTSSSSSETVRIWRKLQPYLSQRPIILSLEQQEHILCLSEDKNYGQLLGFLRATAETFH